MSSTTLPSTIHAQIEIHAAERGDEIFLIAPTHQQQVTFTQLKQRSDDVGEHLDRLGIPTHAKVAFLLDNGVWAVQLFLGIMASNRVAVPINAVAGATQLQHVLKHSDTELIFVAPCYREKLAELLQSIKARVRVIVTSPEQGPEWQLCQSPDDAITTPLPSAESPALLLYTSGSTGLPKGALLSHRAIIRGAHNVVIGHDLTNQDRALCVLPVYHINGAMVTVCAPLLSGGSVVMPERFSVSEFWQLIAKYQCTWASIVPTIINYLLDRVSQEPFQFGEASTLPHFRFARCASAPLPVTVLQQWEKVFCVPMVETLGLTETAGTVASNPMPPHNRKSGSVGLARGNEIKIIDSSNNRDCAVNVPGEIVIRGDNLLDEYYKDSETTRDAFIDGWFRTGDIGLLDEDGYLFVTGRLKELIIRGGENIAPREIDGALYKHHSVLEAAAFGVKHQNYGQEVVACVALREGFNCGEEELKEFCIAAIGEIKSPKKIYFLDELPKGPSGKILRLELPKLIETLEKNT